MIGFFNLSLALELWRAGAELHDLLSIEGMTALLMPLVPSLLVLELIFAIATRRTDLRASYKVPALTFLFNRWTAGLLAFDVIATCENVLWPYALWHCSFTWYGFLYSYLVWELGHYIYHYTCHRIRLLWCFHATHHAPERMNLSVIHVGFFLQGLHANLVRSSFCVLLGVDLGLLAVVMVLDAFWGGFVHVSDELLKDGRLGILHKFMLTPSHHRVHHARNPLYRDKNYCNTLMLWDWLFGTLQAELPGVKPEYGLIRSVNSESFMDVQFSEVAMLMKDVWTAPRYMDKLRYALMPPGWQPGGREMWVPNPSSEDR